MDWALIVFAFLLEEQWFRVALLGCLAVVYTIGLIVMINKWWVVGLMGGLRGIPRIIIPLALAVMPLFVGADWLISPAKE